jgi:hypothetical protein
VLMDLSVCGSPDTSPFSMFHTCCLRPTSLSLNHQTGDVTCLTCEELVTKPPEQVQADAQQVTMHFINQIVFCSSNRGEPKRYHKRVSPSNN